jgi:hypothetical protein
MQQVYDKIARGGDAGTAEARIPVRSLPSSATAQFVITQPGCYCLTDNITGEAGKCCIEIQADHVELECDGFTFIGVQGTLECVRAPSTATGHRRCIGIYDAGFSGWQGACCDLSSAQDCLVEECWFDSCVSRGSGGAAPFCCALGDGGVIYDCDTRRCVGGTMSVGAHGIIEECVSTDCSATPACFACTSGDCVMEDNFAMNCDGVAFSVLNRACVLYNRCVNTAGGVDCGGECVVEENDLDVSSSSGVAAITCRGPRCCTCSNYLSGGGLVVVLGGDGALIEDNHVVGAGGADGTGGGVIFIERGVTRCHVVSNRCRGLSATAAFSIPPGNSYGPICVCPDAGDLSLIPSSSHPQANFVH